jgi:AcrR family transcriptional regulator
MLRARTPQAKDERRQALLTAALDEFFERGFSAARMDDIAARAGLSKGALYLYFDSKDALFTSLIEEFAVPNIERVEAIASQATSAEEALREFTRFAPTLIRESSIPKIMKVLVANAPAFPETATAYRKKVVERGLGVIAGVLAKAKSSGEFTLDDPALAARLVAAPVIFSALWRILFEHDSEAQLDVEALLDLHVRTLIRGLTAEERAKT